MAIEQIKKKSGKAYLINPAGEYVNGADGKPVEFDLQDAIDRNAIGDFNSPGTNGSPALGGKAKEG